MQETPDGSLPRNDRESRAPRISPAATVLTLAAVAFAVLVGVTGPRLRDRVGSVQQDHPLGDLAAIAAMHEARAGADALGGRERDAALARLRTSPRQRSAGAARPTSRPPAGSPTTRATSSSHQA
jgi:hypothetical protein